MAHKIILSPSSVTQMTSLTNYINEIWGEPAALKFIKKFDECITLISVHPDSFPVSNKRKRIRRCLIAPQTSMYYLIRNDVIEVAFLFDIRQSLSALKKQINNVR